MVYCKIWQGSYGSWKSCKVVEFVLPFSRTRKYWIFVKSSNQKIFSKRIVGSVILGFLVMKGTLLCSYETYTVYSVIAACKAQYHCKLMQLDRSLKNLHESLKSPGKLFPKGGYEPWFEHVSLNCLLLLLCLLGACGRISRSGSKRWWDHPGLCSGHKAWSY